VVGEVTRTHRRLDVKALCEPQSRLLIPWREGEVGVRRRGCGLLTVIPAALLRLFAVTAPPPVSKTGTRRDKTQRLEAGGDRWIYAVLREGLGAWPSPPRRVCARMLTPACPCHFANSRARGPNHPSPFVTL
jgi:hypothetical protein